MNHFRRRMRGWAGALPSFRSLSFAVSLLVPLSLSVLALPATAGNAEPSGKTVKPGPYPKYPISSGPMVFENPGQNEAWGGLLGLPPHFCAAMPGWRHARDMDVFMYKSNAIYLARVEYPGNLHVFVVSSTLPPGVNDEADTEAAWKRHKATQQQNANLAKLGRYSSALGTVVAYTVDNPTNSDEGPFPLELNTLQFPDGALRIASAHRLVAERGSRFEVVAYREFPPTTDPTTQSNMRSIVEQAADDTMESLQRCSQAMWSAPPEGGKAN